MLGVYSASSVKRLIARLNREYKEHLQKQRAYAEKLKEENRILRARVMELEGNAGQISSALSHALSESERIVQEGQREAEQSGKELLLLAEKCRLLSARLMQKYPDEEDCKEFELFTQTLLQKLGMQVEEPLFDMDEVLAPSGPLDLEQLCRELGVMEDET